MLKSCSFGKTTGKIQDFSGMALEIIRDYPHEWRGAACAKIGCGPGPPTWRERAAWGQTAYNEEEQPAARTRAAYKNRTVVQCRAMKSAMSWLSFSGISSM